jgi:hypothetical protein
MEMNKKIKVAFIYKKSNMFLTGNHFDNTYYHFLMRALKRNEKVDLTYFPTEERFDASVLKDKFDIIQLWQNNEFGMPSEIVGIQDLNIPVISMVSDVREAKDSVKFHKKWKIDHYFDFIPEEYFHELYPHSFKYKTIIFGLEKSLYENVSPFRDRIKNKILNSGAVGNTKLLSRLINKIRNPKWNNLDGYYLRTKCNELPYVDYTLTLEHEYVNDKYPLLLQKYASAIAATSDTPSIKYWEIPAAGCLTFMEITKENRGDYLGYVDGESSIFISENNYKEKFKEYLDDPENPKWEKIASTGRKYALENFNNDKAVESLVDLMKSLI